MSQVPGLVFLERVRLSFPHLAQPHKSGPDADPKYSADFVLEPSHPGYAAFMAKVSEIATEKWGEQAAGMLQFIGNDKRLRAYGAGEEVINKQTMQPYDGYPGMVYIKANNGNQPALYGADGNPLMNATALYGGCYVNVQVQPWIQDNAHGKAIRCELVGVQFHSDGEAFGAAPIDPSTLFGAIPGAPAPTAAVPGAAPVAQPGMPPQAAPMQAAPMQAAPMQAAPMQAAPVAPQVPAGGITPAQVAQPPGAVQPMAPAPGAPMQAAPVAPQYDPITGLPIAQ